LVALGTVQILRRAGARLAFVLPLLLLLAAVLSSAPTAAADDPREAKGRALFVKGEYQSALEIYATLFSERNDPLYLRNIGRCFQKLRQPGKAIESFREYLRRAPHLKASERREIEGFIREMQAVEASTGAQPPPAAGTAPVTGNGQNADLPAPADRTAGNGAPSGRGEPPTTATTSKKVKPEPDEPVRRMASAGTTTGAGLGGKPAEPSLIDKAPAGGASQPDEDRSVIKRWWFWTGVGAVIAGGVVATLLLRGGGSTRPDCNAGFTCPH
jgi:hypothetical protein